MAPDSVKIIAIATPIATRITHRITYAIHANQYSNELAAELFRSPLYQGFVATLRLLRGSSLIPTFA